MCTPDNMSFLCKKFNKTADYFYFGREQNENNCKKTIKEMINDINDMLKKLSKEETEKAYQIMRILTYS